MALTPAKPYVQYVQGWRHALSALRDALRIDAP